MLSEPLAIGAGHRGILAKLTGMASAHLKVIGPAMEQETPRLTVDDVYEGLRIGQVLENYPGAVRGPCCLINGKTGKDRPIHIVCTTTRTPLFIITVYEPKPPRFVSPKERSRP